MKKTEPTGHQAWASWPQQLGHPTALTTSSSSLPGSYHLPGPQLSPSASRLVTTRGTTALLLLLPTSRVSVPGAPSPHTQSPGSAPRLPSAHSQQVIAPKSPSPTRQAFLSCRREAASTLSILEAPDLPQNAISLAPQLGSSSQLGLWYITIPWAGQARTLKHLLKMLTAPLTILKPSGGPAQDWHLLQDEVDCSGPKGAVPSLRVSAQARSLWTW